MKVLNISEVSKRSGFPSSTLRYYEDKGLIRSTGRHGLRRLFDPGILQRLSLIALGREAGFSLEEIATMFKSNGDLSIDRRTLATKADELDNTVKRLAAISDALRHAAACPAPSHLECPTFQRLLRVVKKRRRHRSSSNSTAMQSMRKSI